jgi:transcription initiation factor IIF auxiliary subunit
VCQRSLYDKLLPESKSLTEQCRLVKKNPPFRIEEDGWGEFVVEILLTDLGGKEHPISHDLNFSQERYENKQVITFKNPKGDLAATLRASGPVPGDTGGELANGKKGGRTSGVGGADSEGGRKRKKTDMRGIDMDSLAEKLQKLGEDDLLQVVQMVHDHKGEDSWMRNDVDRECITQQELITHSLTTAVCTTEGEFHVDLYTLPEVLIKMLWEFTNERVGTS